MHFYRLAHKNELYFYGILGIHISPPTSQAKNGNQRKWHPDRQCNRLKKEELFQHLFVWFSCMADLYIFFLHGFLLCVGVCIAENL